jgi:ABC-type nitrate/sulfonate/bicarbonate transport system substrate-binding protein
MKSSKQFDTNKVKRAAYRSIWSLAVCAIMAVAANAFGASKVTIGYATVTARLMPLWIAHEQGLFAKYGIDAQPILIRGAPTLVAGLASGDIQIGRTGGSAMLAAVSAGHDFKFVASFSSRNTYDVVTRPNIKRAEDLRGKRFAVTSIGGTTWMGVLLWLEHFGLDEQRDKIQMQVVGDQGIQAQAVETGLCDAAVLDGAFSRKLKQKGMNIIAEYSEMTKLLAGQSMVVPNRMLQQQGDLAENYLKAEIEGLAYSLAPKNKPTVLKAMMKYLRTDAAGAEDGYLDLTRGVDRKPIPSVEGLRNVQRLLKLRNPKVGDVKVEDVIDGRIARRLDESGFIDKTFAAYGASLK